MTFEQLKQCKVFFRQVRNVLSGFSWNKFKLTLGFQYPILACHCGPVGNILA